MSYLLEEISTNLGITKLLEWATPEEWQSLEKDSLAKTSHKVSLLFQEEGRELNILTKENSGLKNR